MLGVPVKPTIKEVDKNGNVVKTLARAGLWEVQTPQVGLQAPCNFEVMSKLRVQA